MLLMCFSVAPSVMSSSVAIPTFVRPSAIAASTSRSRGVRRRQRVVGPVADHELGDDLGIERRAAPGDASQGVHELADVADAVLEQVADAAGAVGEQLGRVLPLDVLAQHEDRRAGHAAARLDRRPEALVALARRHPDVDDRHVRPVRLDRLDERVAVADLGDDRAARLLDQPGDALADERRVLGDDDPQRCFVHGPILRRRLPGERGLPENAHRQRRHRERSR